MTGLVQSSVDGHVQVIRLNRADKKNALNAEMYAALTERIRGADADNGIRVSVITGSGDAFCSGNDINDFLARGGNGASDIIAFIEAITGAEKPLIAAVNGHAIGIGATMLLHCDLVYAADAARFQFPFVNVGLCPEAGSSFLLPRLVGRHMASELLLLGRMFDAAEAKRFGIVNDIVPGSQLEALAFEKAEEIASRPPGAVRATKQLLRAAVSDALAAAGRREIEAFVPLLNGAEAREALSAFIEKRPPDFSRF
jgi:enoyl-CoA hydratase/carnithine racemase